LLDYIGADYPPTVEAGKVIDESEYREQVEFLGVLQGLVADLPEKPERAELVKGVDELLAAVTARAEGATVAHHARQLGAQAI
jgi:high-affinity iron transporter